MKNLIFLVFLWVFPLVCGAQSVGILCWEAAPFNQVFCFEISDVNKNGKYYSLTGENIVPRDGSFPVMGAAVLDGGSGVFRLQFTQHLGGRAVFHNLAVLDSKSFNGTWSDDSGNQGDFKFLGFGPLDSNKIEEVLSRAPVATRKLPD